MKKYTAILLIGYLIPCVAWAEVPDSLPHDKYSLIPKWVECPGMLLEKDGAKGYVCYGFSAIKTILSVEQDAIKWHNLNLHLGVQVEDLTTANQKLHGTVTSLEGDVKRLSEGYAGVMKTLGETEARAVRAERRDVFSGRVLPWLVAGAAVLLAAGFVGGWYGHSTSQ